MWMEVGKVPRRIGEDEKKTNSFPRHKVKVGRGGKETVNPAGKGGETREVALFSKSRA